MFILIYYHHLLTMILFSSFTTTYLYFLILKMWFRDFQTRRSVLTVYIKVSYISTISIFFRMIDWYYKCPLYFLLLISIIIVHLSADLVPQFHRFDIDFIITNITHSRVTQSYFRMFNYVCIFVFSYLFLFLFLFLRHWVLPSFLLLSISFYKSSLHLLIIIFLNYSYIIYCIK